MADLATKDDVAAGWRVLTPAEQAVATTLCKRASAIVRSKVPGVDDRIAAAVASATDDYEELVIGVVSDMVKRVLVNPDCRRSDSIDDAQWTIDQAASTGALYVSATELGLLLTPPAVAQAGTPAYVISLGG